MLSLAWKPLVAVFAFFFVLATTLPAQSAGQAQGQADPRGNVILGNDRPKKDKKAPTTRSVKGKVTDDAGKPLDHALVTLTNEVTHVSLTFSTKAGGQYYFDDLSFTTDYKLAAQYKDKKSQVRTLSQYDRAPNIVRILQIDQPATSDKPAETAEKKP
jgi:Carboxypeptidase regulatory-like domain